MVFTHTSQSLHRNIETCSSKYQIKRGLRRALVKDLPLASNCRRDVFIVLFVDCLIADWPRAREQAGKRKICSHLWLQQSLKNINDKNDKKKQLYR